MDSRIVAKQRLLFVALCAIWGTTWLAVKFGVDAVPPSFFAGTRFVTAGALFLAWCGARGIRLRFSPPAFGRLLVVAVLMVTATYAPLYWGQRFVGAGLAAVLNLSVMPLAMLGFAIAGRQERFTLRQAGAIGLGVLGLFILFSRSLSSGGPGGGPGGDPLPGAIAIIASTLAYCAGSVVARPLLRSHPPTLVAGASNLLGGILLVAGSLAFEPGATHAALGQWGWMGWASWLFLVVFGSLVGTSIYLVLLRDWGASRAGSYAFVCPAVAVILGVLLDHETLHPAEALGMALMLAATMIALGAWPARLTRRRPARA